METNEVVVELRRKFMPVPTMERKTNRTIATLYNSRISDFFPTYFAPNGTATITAKRNENERNQKRNGRSFAPKKMGINARYGMAVRKHKLSINVFPYTILSFFTGRFLKIHMVFSSVRNKFSAGKTAVYITTI